MDTQTSSVLKWARGIKKGEGEGEIVFKHIFHLLAIKIMMAQ